MKHTDKLKISMLDFLKRRRDKQVAEEERDKDDSITLPPFVASQVIYNDRIRVLKFIALFNLIIAMAFCGLFLIDRNKKETLIIPGAPDFMRVRAGSIPDEVVYAFADYVARNLGTFSFRTVERQYKDISEFMAPEFKYRFITQTEAQLPALRELRVDEIFDADPVKNYQIKSDLKGAKYVVAVSGITKKFIDGNLRDTVSEAFLIEFRTTAISKNKPWMFQVESFRRTTPEEEEKRKRAEQIELQAKGEK